MTNRNSVAVGNANTKNSKSAIADTAEIPGVSFGDEISVGSHLIPGDLTPEGESLLDLGFESDVSTQFGAGDVRSVLQDSVRRLDPQEKLGAVLREARRAKGMTVNEIGRITRIPQVALGHIESGRFSNLPGDVFARGFLRSYSRCVGLDGDDVVRKYAQCGLSPAPVSSPLADAVLRSGGADGRKKTRVNRRRDAPGPVHGSQSKIRSGRRGRRHRDEGQGGSHDTGSAVVAADVLGDAFDLSSSKKNSSKKSASKKASYETLSKRNASEKFGVDCFDLSPGPRDAHAVPSECVTRPKRARTFVPPSFNFDEDMTHRGPLTLGVIILVIVATLTMSYLLRRPGTLTDGFTWNDATQGADQDTLPSVATLSVSAPTPVART